MTHITSGQSIGSHDWCPGALDLFLYSAAVWLPHKIHYDSDYARGEGHDGVVVHGPLLMARMSQLAQEWAADVGGRLAYARFRLLKTAYADRPLRSGGQVVGVVADGANLLKVECDVWTQDVATEERVAQGLVSILIAS